MTCRNTGLGEQVHCILSYDGSLTDTILNYTVLVLNLIVAATPILRSREGRPADNKGFRAFLSLIFTVFFQILLCLVVQCSGISIIWCSIFGWIIMDWRKRDGNASRTIAVHQIIIMFIDLATNLYYAIVAEAITTVAHM